MSELLEFFPIHCLPETLHVHKYICTYIHMNILIVSYVTYVATYIHTRCIYSVYISNTCTPQIYTDTNTTDRQSVTRMHTCTHARTHTRTYTHIHTHMDKHTYTATQTHIHMHTQTHMATRTYIHTLYIVTRSQGRTAPKEECRYISKTPSTSVLQHLCNTFSSHVLHCS